MNTTKLIHKLILPCDRATLLIEKRDANAITTIERIRLNIHLKLCKWCQAYNQKISVIGELIEKHFQKTEKKELSEEFIQEFKEKTIQKLSR